MPPCTQGAAQKAAPAQGACCRPNVGRHCRQRGLACLPCCCQGSLRHAKDAADLSASHLCHRGRLILALRRRPRLASTIHDAAVGLLDDCARQRHRLQHCEQGKQAGKRATHDTRVSPGCLRGTQHIPRCCGNTGVIPRLHWTSQQMKGVLQLRRRPALIPASTAGSSEPSCTTGRAAALSTHLHTPRGARQCGCPCRWPSK